MTDAPNTLFPGRPNYTGPTTGWFGLLHHVILCEQSHNVMERVAYVKRKKPVTEIAIRLHNMIYLGDCETVAKCDALDAEYQAKRDALDAGYQAKRAPLYDEILAYIRQHIPDCAWDETRQELRFT